jgi:hypothetical protein
MSQEIIDKDEECCSICLEIINKNNNKVITNCGHTFHCICIMKNVSINGFACPYCRTNIAEDKKTMEEDNTMEEYYTTEEDSTSVEISIIANTNEDISEYRNIEYRNISVDNINFDIIDNYTAIINDNNNIIRNNDNIIRNNDENINENILDRLNSYHQSRLSRRTNSIIEELRRHRLELERQEIVVSQLTSENQVIQQQIQEALQGNNISIPPPATYSNPFERLRLRSSNIYWRTSNI